MKKRIFLRAAAVTAGLVLAIAFAFALAGAPAYAGSPPVTDDNGFQEDNEKFGEFDDAYEQSAGVIWSDSAVLCTINDESGVVTLRFVPEHDGAYIFKSADNPDDEHSDPLGRVVAYDESEGRYRQVKEDDESEGNNQFKFEFYAKAGETYYLQTRMWYDDRTGSFIVSLEEDVFNASISVDLDKATGVATVTGLAEGDTFRCLCIDGYVCQDVDIDGLTSFSAEIDMDDYSAGMHDIYAELTNHPDQDFYVHNAQGVPTSIKKAPSNKIGYYETGNKYIRYTYKGNGYDDCGIMLEYRKGSGAWKKVGPIKPGNTKKISKLSVGKTYSIRTYFCVKGKFNGQPYEITGKDFGKVSKVIKVKTAAAKPAVKSIKITGAKHVSYTYQQPVWYRTWIGTTLYIYLDHYETIKAWKTTYRVTVNLKRKPGAAGIYIDGKKLKGNKKTYSAKMETSGKMKGKKLKVKVYSYQSNQYHGYSQKVSKKVTVR